MKVSNRTVCFITFAGSPGETDSRYSDIRKAGERIILQAKASDQFQNCILLDWEMLINLCTKHKIKIPLNPHRYSFTPILLKLISLNAFGSFNYVLYAGAGCEINTNFFARKDLEEMINIASRDLFYIEHNLLLEKEYTKREVFNDLQVSLESETTPQICATFFMVSTTTESEKLVAIADNWLEYSSRKNGFYISDDYNPEIQISSFVAHRNDQSLLSIVLKKHQIKSKLEKQRNYERFFPSVRGATIFLWTNRNRSGISKIPKHTKLFINGLIAALVTPFINLTQRKISAKKSLSSAKLRNS